MLQHLKFIGVVLLTLYAVPTNSQSVTIESSPKYDRGDNYGEYRG